MTDKAIKAISHLWISNGYGAWTRSIMTSVPDASVSIALTSSGVLVDLSVGAILTLSHALGAGIARGRNEALPILVCHL